MPAVTSLLATIAPASVADKAARPGYALQDLLSARTPENAGVRASAQASQENDEGAAKSFASALEKGLEQQAEQRESRRSARDDATRRAEEDRKEDAAATADSGSTLPPDGRHLPPEQTVSGSASAAAVALADASPALAGAPVTSSSPAPLLPETELPRATPVAAVPAALALAQPQAPATDAGLETAAPLPPVSVSPPSQHAVPALVSAQTMPHEPAPSLVTAADAQAPLPGARPASEGPDTQAMAASAASLPSAPQVTLSPGSEALSVDTAPGAAAFAATRAPGTEAAMPAASSPAATDNPLTAMGEESEPDAMAASPRTVREQDAETREWMQAFRALAQASGADQTSVPELNPVQGELAERVRAWRGLSGLEGPGSPSLFSRSEAVGSSLFSQSSGQLQQFAESLRLAVNQAESPSLLSAAERSAGSTSPAPGALSSAATAPAPDAGSPWRADNLQLPAVNGSARPAAGTLQFMQSMQPSSFGAPLGETFGQNAWAESVTQRVALMTGQKLSSARIELDPPELGAMTVKVSVSGDQASVSFASPHALVRDALEQTFPRLQEMLGQQGLHLADAQVSDQSAQQRQSGETAAGGRQDTADTGDNSAESVSLQSVKVATSLIDYYA